MIGVVNIRVFTFSFFTITTLFFSLSFWYFTALNFPSLVHCFHYCDVIMGTMASEITSLTIVYSTVYSGADQRKHQSSASLAFVRGIHRCPVNSPHKWPVTRKMFPFDDVIMWLVLLSISSYLPPLPHPLPYFHLHHLHHYQHANMFRDRCSSISIL